jgi:hypothetical protein
VNTIGKITKKVLNVAIPRGATEDQIKMIDEAIKYAKSLKTPIEVIIKVVK